MKKITYIAALFVGFGLGLVFTSEAHPPCDQPVEQCGYELKVNPLTGELESIYICRQQ